MPDSSALMAPAFRLIDAGRRKDPAVATEVLHELLPTDDALARDILVHLVGVIASIAGGLVAKPNPRRVLAQGVAAHRRGA